jgi:hypothetical protein
MDRPIVAALWRWSREAPWRWARSWSWCRPGRFSGHSKCIDLIVVGEVNASVDSNAGIESARAGRQFVLAAAGINNIASVSIETVQSLIAAHVRTKHLDNHVIGAISRGCEGRSSAGLAYAPSTDDAGWISCGNAEGRKGGAASSESDVGALLGPIDDCCLDDVAVGNMSRGYRRANATQVVATQQVRVGILAQCNHQSRWRCFWNIHEQWAATSNIRVSKIDVQPIGRCPVIARRAAKDGAGLKAHHSFAATPVATSV